MRTSSENSPGHFDPTPHAHPHSTRTTQHQQCTRAVAASLTLPPTLALRAALHWRALPVPPTTRRTCRSRPLRPRRPRTRASCTAGTQAPAAAGQRGSSVDGARGMRWSAAWPTHRPPHQAAPKQPLLPKETTLPPPAPPAAPPHARGWGGGCRLPATAAAPEGRRRRPRADYRGLSQWRAARGK